MKQDVDTIIEYICQEDLRYHPDAYDFVLEALSFTQKKFRRLKHVTGKELLEGIKEFVMHRFGPMGFSVLKHWGVHSTQDFGHIVFNLVDKKLLTKTDDDRFDDFKDVYDFDHIFNQVYRQRLNKRISRMR